MRKCRPTPSPSARCREDRVCRAVFVRRLCGSECSRSRLRTPGLSGRVACLRGRANVVDVSPCLRVFLLCFWFFSNLRHLLRQRRLTPLEVPESPVAGIIRVPDEPKIASPAYRGCETGRLLISLTEMRAAPPIKLRLISLSKDETRWQV